MKLSIRNIHKYLSFFISLQLLLWTVSGIYFSFNKIELVRGEQYRLPSSFSLNLDQAGTYPIDVKVIWLEGVDRGLDDFYGPTVNVGQDNSNSGGESEAEDTLTESSDDIPSLSLFVSVLLISIIAISRRQR